MTPEKRTLLAWQSMHARCYNPRDASYKHYGARGITVCWQWHAFDAFLADLGPAPPGLSLDRENVNGPYVAWNCRWATATQQARNKTNTRWVTYRGETLSVTTWAERVGISVSAMRTRFDKGWSVERALNTPSLASPNVWRGPRHSEVPVFRSNRL